MLCEKDQERYKKDFELYLKGSSGQYVYRIKGKGKSEEHLQRMGEVIYHLLDELKTDYAQEPAYQVLQRFFDDNFRLEAAEVQTKTNEELESGSLQSVDDLEATYRKKGRKKYKGYVANLTETCDPENELQLITKVQVAPNNINDNDLLVEALPRLEGTYRPGKTVHRWTLCGSECGRSLASLPGRTDPNWHQWQSTCSGQATSGRLRDPAERGCCSDPDHLSPWTNRLGTFEQPPEELSGRL